MSQQNKKLKVLHTMTWLAPGGGVDINVLLTINGLKDEYDFDLIVGHEIYHNDFENVEDLKIFISKDLDKTFNLWGDLKALWYFYKVMKKEKYDIVHTHETKASLIGRIAAWMAGVPYIIYGLHGVTFNDPMSDLRRKIYIGIEKYTTWMVDYIVTVSQDTIDQYHINNITTKIPYGVVYSGIDTKKFTGYQQTEAQRREIITPLGISDDDFVITNIGRFSNSKAQRYTIEVFSKIKKDFPNTKLLLIGDGELIEDCKSQVAELGLSDDVIFYGFTTDIIPLVHNSDLMMITSLREGLPRVVVEASLCGKPTIGFQVEGIREIILPKYHEYIVPQYDVETLTKQTLKLMKDKNLRAEFGKDQQKRASESWDFSNMNASLRKIYNKEVKI